MEQLLSDEELVGKKIKKTDIIEDYYFVFFEDETFCVFHAPRTRGIKTMLLTKTYHTAVTVNNGEKMVEHGFCTQEQFDNHIKTLASLRESVAKDNNQRKKEEQEYEKNNKGKVTKCCGSKNHYLFQGQPYCHECNSVCELE